jgi:predicted enzyme involved in methoxymalonyl-ACP biosynthesis
LYGRQRKLLVLDTATMLWDGQGAGDAPSAATLGRAYADFLQSLHLLRCRGVMLAVLGKIKNSELANALDGGPGQDLRSGDFAAVGSADEDMAANLGALAASLAVTLDAVVYIDAQGTARARMIAALPAVYVPEWPTDKLLFPSALQGLRCFDAAATFADRLAAAQ